MPEGLPAPPAPRVDPLAFVPREAFRLEKARVTEPLRRPGSVASTFGEGAAVPAAAEGVAPPSAQSPLSGGGAACSPLLSPPPLPTAGSTVDGRRVERARTLESCRGGFSAIVPPRK